ncbi:MAG: hypothetical protein LUF32_06575 [Clostridiales bacterium]|nr:hypothetical protein [Clostridiales bacterium]
MVHTDFMKVNSRKLMERLNTTIFRNILFINIVYFLIYFFIFTPRYETNDDQALDSIVSGYRGSYTSHLVFINIFLGKILKMLVTVLPAVKWYPLMHFSVLFVGFVLISYILVKKCNRFGYIFVFIILTYFGYECYVNVQFTKTAGVASVAGAIAIFYALDNREKRKRHVVLGYLLLLTGSFLRFKAYGIVLILLAVLGIAQIVKYYQIRTDIKKFCLKSLKYILIWAIMIGSTGVFYYLDAYIYDQSPEWSYYREFNQKRAVLTDTGFPDYEQNIETYTELGISENDYYLFTNWTFADPDVFTVEVMDELIALKTHDDIQYRSVFFRELLPGFLKERSFQAFVSMFLIWLFLCRKKKGAVLYVFLAIAGINVYFIYLHRYLQNRVDTVVWLAAVIVFAFLIGDYIKAIRSRKAMLFCCVILACMNMDLYKTNLDLQSSQEDIAYYTDFYNMVLGDKDTLYLTDVVSGNQTGTVYSIFESIPFGIQSNYYTLGGWGTNMPTNLEVLANYNIENPFRDIINNEQVCIISNSSLIDNILIYIQEHYDSGAYLDKIYDDGRMQIYHVRS